MWQRVAQTSVHLVAFKRRSYSLLFSITTGPLLYGTTAILFCSLRMVRCSNAAFKCMVICRPDSRISILSCCQAHSSLFRCTSPRRNQNGSCTHVRIHKQAPACTSIQRGHLEYLSHGDLEEMVLSFRELFGSWVLRPWNATSGHT